VSPTSGLSLPVAIDAFSSRSSRAGKLESAMVAVKVDFVEIPSMLHMLPHSDTYVYKFCGVNGVNLSKMIYSNVTENYTNVTCIV
jgi:hypothetical protein